MICSFCVVVGYLSHSYLLLYLSLNVVGRITQCDWRRRKPTNISESQGHLTERHRGQKTSDRKAQRKIHLGSAPKETSALWFRLEAQRDSGDPREMVALSQSKGWYLWDSEPLSSHSKLPQKIILMIYVDFSCTKKLETSYNPENQYFKRIV